MYLSQVEEAAFKAIHSPSYLLGEVYDQTGEATIEVCMQTYQSAVIDLYEVSSRYIASICIGSSR